MLRFVHAADLHLDSPLGAAQPRVAEALRSSLRQAFESLIELCLAERVDALLLAGDVFDRPHPDPQTLRWFRRQIRRLHDRGITVVAVSGNHDPGDGPDWNCAGLVRVVGAEPQSLELRRPGEDRRLGTLVAAGHPRAGCREPLIEAFPRQLPRPVVGMLHGQVEGGSGEHARYAPFRREDLRQRPYDYWALGHVHRRQRLDLASECWYSGNLAGRQERERGAKGALLVEIPDEGPPSVQFRELAPVRFVALKLRDPGRLRGLEDVLAAAREALAVASIPASRLARCVLRLRVEGPTPVARELPLRWLDRRDRLGEWEEELGAELGVLALHLPGSELREPVDLGELARQPHVLGEAARLLQEAGEGGALRALLERSEGGGAELIGAPERDPEGYVRGLLDDVGRELSRRVSDGAGGSR